MTNNRQVNQQHHVVRLPGSGRVWWGLALGTVLIMLVTVITAGEKSIFKVIALYQERQHLQTRTEQIKQENKKMSEQIEQLKSNPRAVEQIAREELGMVRPDEVIYRFVPASSEATNPEK